MFLLFFFQIYVPIAHIVTDSRIKCSSHFNHLSNISTFVLSLPRLIILCFWCKWVLTVWVLYQSLLTLLLAFSLFPPAITILLLPPLLRTLLFLFYFLLPSQGRRCDVRQTTASEAGRWREDGRNGKRSSRVRLALHLPLVSFLHFISRSYVHTWYLIFFSQH